jgi:hypothetical protein
MDSLEEKLLLKDFSDLMRRPKVTVTSIGAVSTNSDEINENNRLG